MYSFWEEILRYRSLNLAAVCSSSNSEGCVSSRTTVNLHSPIQVMLNERNPWDVNEATFKVSCHLNLLLGSVCVDLLVMSPNLWTLSKRNMAATGTLSIIILRPVEWLWCSQNKLIEYTVYCIHTVTSILLNLAQVHYESVALSLVSKQNLSDLNKAC